MTTWTCSRQQHIVLEIRVGGSLYPAHADEGGVETDVDGSPEERFVPVVVRVGQKAFQVGVERIFGAVTVNVRNVTSDSPGKRCGGAKRRNKVEVCERGFEIGFRISLLHFMTTSLHIINHECATSVWENKPPTISQTWPCDSQPRSKRMQANLVRERIESLSPEKSMCLKRLFVNMQ